MRQVRKMTPQKLTNGGVLIHELKKMGKALERDKRLGENRLFEAELQELIKTMRGTFFPAEGKEPLLGSKLAALPVIDDETVKELINTEKLSRYVSEEELDSLVPGKILPYKRRAEKPRFGRFRIYRENVCAERP